MQQLEVTTLQPEQNSRFVTHNGLMYTFPVLPSWHMQVFSIEDVKAILDHRKRFDAYGAVYDSDLFGSPMRRLKFCETANNIFDHGVDWFDEVAPPAYRGNDELPWRPVS
jgi:hypothetical protein